MRIITVKMPESYIEAIDELVRLGRYASRSEVIRAAIRELLKRELWSANSSAVGERSIRSRYIEVIDDFK
ncbi:MAG: ribbon-helix-helix domain-containing protein [Ignisphaera sp.]|uniref:Ribbon-helix-helix protein, CopG family n=1 Tax=Ignisphaera aggregans TaxID=334771 RepID=A0A7C4NLM8_9CREN